MSIERSLSSLALLWEVAKRWPEATPDPEAQWLDLVRSGISTQLRLEEITYTGRAWLDKVAGSKVEAVLGRRALEG